MCARVCAVRTAANFFCLFTCGSEQQGAQVILDKSTVVVAISETKLYWRKPFWAAMNWCYCLVCLTLTVSEWGLLSESVYARVFVKPQIEIWFGLSLVRSVKIYALRGNCRLGGNYYRPPSCCYSLTAGGFLHKSPDSMRTVSQHVCV